MSSDLLSLAEAARSLPGRPHLSTLHRWRLTGVRGVRLETVLVGGRRFVSREAIKRFIEATTAASDGKPTAVRTAKQRERDIAAAERELDAILG